MNSKAETVFNESDIDDILESICVNITSNIQKIRGAIYGWVIDSAIVQTINI